MVPAVDNAEPGGDPAIAAAEEKDLLCPICMQIIQDAFLTSCGHSFCYMCIVTHLHNKSDCPCCAHFLTPSQLFPNFLLNKLLKKTSAQQLLKTASPVEQFRQSLDQACQVSVKELDSLLSLVAEKKRKLEQEEAERNMQILQEFLHRLRKQKVNELNEVQSNLEFIKDDLNAVERHRIELCQARARCSVKPKMFSDDPLIIRSRTPRPMDRNISGVVCNSYNIKRGITPVKKTNQVKAQIKIPGTQSNEAAPSEPTSPDMSQSGLAVMRKKRVHGQFNELQEFYLQKRRQLVNHLEKQEKKDKTIITREGYSSGLADFQSVLSTFTRYSRLRVIAELRHGDLFQSPNIVSRV